MAENLQIMRQLGKPVTWQVSLLDADLMSSRILVSFSLWSPHSSATLRGNKDKNSYWKVMPVHYTHTLISLLNVFLFLRFSRITSDTCQLLFKSKWPYSSSVQKLLVSLHWLYHVFISVCWMRRNTKQKQRKNPVSSAGPVLLSSPEVARVQSARDLGGTTVHLESLQVYIYFLWCLAQ